MWPPGSNARSSSMDPSTSSSRPARASARARALPIVSPPSHAPRPTYARAADCDVLEPLTEWRDALRGAGYTCHTMVKDALASAEGEAALRVALGVEGDRGFPEFIEFLDAFDHQRRKLWNLPPPSSALEEFVPRKEWCEALRRAGYTHKTLLCAMVSAEDRPALKAILGLEGKREWNAFVDAVATHMERVKKVRRRVRLFRAPAARVRARCSARCSLLARLPAAVLLARARGTRLPHLSAQLAPLTPPTPAYVPLLFPRPQADSQPMPRAKMTPLTDWMVQAERKLWDYMVSRAAGRGARAPPPSAAVLLRAGRSAVRSASRWRATAMRPSAS